MKKISLAILIIGVISITTLTIYTLTHKQIEDSEKVIKIKSIEKASSNMTEHELSEIYNVELNGKRHRLKSNYRLNFLEDKTELNLTLYLDGFEILQMVVDDDIKAKTIDEVFNENENSFPKIEEDSIKIIKEDQDYLLVSIESNTKEEYFVWNSKGDNLIKNLLVYDESINYISTTEEPLAIFYDEEKQIMAKIEDNEIYALEAKEEKENIIIEEYKYQIKKNKVKKELINTYENITIKSK